jgi:tetrahydromethanopterin S-methyltransferase subunit G
VTPVEGSPDEARAPEVSAPGRVIGAFFSPNPTFRSIAARPSFLLPMILWTLASVAITFVLIPKMDYERLTRQRLEKSGRTMSEEQIQSTVAMQKKIGSKIAVGIGFIGPAVVSLVVTLIFWAAFKAFGWDFTFKQGYGATAHAYLPNVLASLLIVPILAQRESVDPQAVGDLLRSNLGFLVEKSASPALHSILSSIDVFALWTAILLTIGYAAAARISRKAAGGVVFAIWALFVLGKAGVTALTS